MNKRLIPAAVAAALLGSGVAVGNELEEIVVTAQKRAESLADVPISLTVVSGDQIQKQGTATLEQLAYSIPNLKITQTALANRIAIRGIATGDNKGFEQSVAMFVDGIYYGRDQLVRLPLVDLERVEVLRGPQPTLFGKNAIAGAVSVITRKPTEEFEASVDVMHELEADETRFTGVLSGPLSDNVRARLVANYREMDGYVYNTKMQRNEPKLDESFLRGQIDFGGESGVRGNLKLEYADFKTQGQPREVFGPVGSYSASFVGPLAVETAINGKREDNGYESDNEVTNAILTLDIPFGENTLTSVTGLLDYNVKELIDVDFSPISLLDGTNQSEDYQQISQELRITSPTSGSFNYIAGVYYQKSELDVTDLVVFNRTFLGFGAPFNAIGDTTNDRLYSQNSTLWSAFAQTEFALSDRLRLTVGARFNDESKDGSRVLTVNKGAANPAPLPVVQAVFRALNIEAHSIAGDLSESSFNPMANLKFDLSDNVMMYATYARGSKAGGFDVRSNSLPTSTTVARPGAFKFDEETADNIEAGIRYNRSDLSLQVSAYHTKYKDLQVNIFDGTLNFNVRNAAEAVTKGIEADGRVAVGEFVTLSAAVAYLDFEFENFTSGQCYFQQTPGANGFCDYTGQRNAVTPEWSGTLGFDFARPIGNSLKFGVNLNVDFSSSYIAAANLDPRTKQDSFEKFGARVSLGSADDRWEVALVGRNLTDETILQTAGAMPLATTITRNTGVAYNGIFDRPKSIALSARYRF